MSPKAKREYLKEVVERYRLADKEEKTLILNELCLVCGYHRKYAIERINTFSPTLPRKRPGKPSFYAHKDILRALREIWWTANLPNSKRLKAMIPQWLPFMPNIDQFTRLALLKISPATIDRLLKRSRNKFKHKGLSSTKPGTLLRNQIPIKLDQWQEFKPGFIEADTVAHCGTYLDGMFAYTLDCVDIATGWTEQRATWGSGHIGVLERIKDIETTLPFPILGFDSDCGHEFINHNLMHYLTERANPIQFTRSRPYKKNDNAHIEQKNWTHVRQWIGYDRIDNKRIVDLLNDLYKNEWRLFFNFFIPSVKLMAKTRCGSKTIKTHDTPKTPYQRVLESSFIPDETKEKLRQTYQTLNPFDLREAIENKLHPIMQWAKRLESAPSIRYP